MHIHSSMVCDVRGCEIINCARSFSRSVNQNDICMVHIQNSYVVSAYRFLKIHLLIIKMALKVFTDSLSCLNCHSFHSKENGVEG